MNLTKNRTCHNCEHSKVCLAFIGIEKILEETTFHPSHYIKVFDALASECLSYKIKKEPK